MVHPSQIDPCGKAWYSPTRCVCLIILGLHVHSYRSRNPHTKRQEKNWWKGQVMKSGDLPGFGWMPTIDPSKAWGISRGHKGT